MDFEKLLAATSEASTSKQHAEHGSRSQQAQQLEDARLVCAPETASRLRAYVNRQQESGSIDASEVVDQAIAAWLDQHAA
jgi:hypothetical protein